MAKLEEEEGLASERDINRLESKLMLLENKINNLVLLVEMIYKDLYDNKEKKNAK